LGSKQRAALNRAIQLALTMASNAPRTASIDTMMMSLPGL
jgi:hypothetical protein